MKLTYFITIAAFMLCSCQPATEYSSVNPVNWKNKTLRTPLPDGLKHGSTYLSIYSQIYSQTEHRKIDLTAIVSLRNTHRKDTVYINKAEYFDTDGNSIRTYFDQTIFIKPMETVEIVIDEVDQSGGTGANFIFDWSIKPNLSSPLFEGVMISTSGQQGLSFTTKGHEL